MYSLDDQLIVALKKRDFNEADNLLAQGADINAKNMRDETIIFMFLTTQTQEMLNWLVKNGADLNVSDREGNTPFFKAVLNNEAEAVRILIEAGADINKKNNRQIAPLMQAVLNENGEKVFDLLMAAGPDLDCESETGTTPVMAAAARKNVHYVDTLLGAGASSENVDYMGISLLHAAVSSFSPQVVQTVLKHAPFLDPNYRARSGSSPMSDTRGVPAILETLLDIGGDPNAKSGNRMTEGSTLLMGVLGFSAMPDIPLKKKKGQDNTVQMIMQTGLGALSDDLLKKMIQKGADVHARDDFGKNPAHYAIEGMSTGFLPTLVAHGLDPKRPVNPSSTLPYDLFTIPMVDLENSRCLELIDEWHAAGFPFERPEWDEAIDGPFTQKMQETFTPHGTVLSQWAHVGFWDGLEKAIDLGADVNAKGSNDNTLAHGLVGGDVNGMTPQLKKAIQLAKSAKNVDETTKAEQLKAFEDEAEARLQKIKDMVNAKNINWEARTKGGQTPLHVAASKGLVKWAKYLMMEMNVDPTIKDERGLTPADVALKEGHLELFHALCETAARRGFDVKTDALLSTVLAAEDDYRLRQPWVEAIKAYDWSLATVNKQDEEGKTPLYIASGTDQHDVVRALLRVGADPNIASNEGNTPLMEAIFVEDGEIIRMLRAKDAKTNAKNKAGHSVEDVANYVKSKYVHDALSSDNIADVVASLNVPAPTPVQALMKKRFVQSMDNLVRDFCGEEQIVIPDLTDEEKEMIKKEQEDRALSLQQAQQQQTSASGGVSAPSTVPAGAAMTAPRSASNPKAPYKAPRSV